jgi:predicted aldo/keto reductase-like oxidoreductase
MKKIRFGRTGLMVTRVACGGIAITRLSKPEAVKVVRAVIDMGINFFDTGHSYNDSEEKIGEAIKGIPRDKLVIASKTQATDKKTFLENLDLSLKRLGTDYLDIYQFHNIATKEKNAVIEGPDGALEGIREGVKEGKIRFLAFSSHNIPLAMEIMKTGIYAAVQLPINYIDTVAEKAVPLAKELDMGFIAMKPMGGGLLDDAGLSFRYLLQFDNIVPDPGIEREEEMRQIIDIVNENKPLSAEDKKKIEALRKEFGPEWCHRCDYCQPCPQKISISSVLNAKSAMKRMPFERAYKMVNDNMKKAKTCIACGDCKTRCPYSLNIPVLLKDRIKFWEQTLKEHPPVS